MDLHSNVAVLLRHYYCQHMYRNDIPEQSIEFEYVSEFRNIRIMGDRKKGPSPSFFAFISELNTRGGGSVYRKRVPRQSFAKICLKNN